MKRLIPVFVALSACVQGARGPTGPAGTCDTTTCPQQTSLNGLSGGSLTSALSVAGSVSATEDVSAQGSVTASAFNLNAGTSNLSPSSPQPYGIVVMRGAGRTSIGGFYCGKTTFNVDGNFNQAGASQPLTEPLVAAKDYCSTACNAAPAHPCLTTELLVAVQLYDGHVTNDVPLPTGVSGWVLAPDVVSSCAGLHGDNTQQGILYNAVEYEGTFQRASCTDAHPLLCCF